VSTLIHWGSLYNITAVFFLIPFGIVIVAEGSSLMIIDILVLCMNSLLPVGPKIVIPYGSNVKIIIWKCFLCPLYSPKNGLMG